MAIPKDLEKKLEKLAHFFGGYAAVRQLASEERLTEIAVFSGPIGTISPLSEVGTVENPIRPLHTLNLEAIGYRGGKYHVFNHEMSLLYSAIATRHNGTYVFGLNEKDIKLTQRGRHGEHFYLQLGTPRGPQLAILWLCRELPGWAIERKLIQWEQEKASYNAALQYNELIIELPAEPEIIYAAVIPGNISEQLRAQEIIYKADELGEGYIAELDAQQPGYLRLSSDSWVTLWQEQGAYKKLIALKDFEGTGKERLFSLPTSWFLKGSRMSGGWLFSTGTSGSRPVISNAFEPQYIRLVAKAVITNQVLEWP